MSWIPGNTPHVDIVDHNKAFYNLTGELDEETTRLALGRFFMTNIGFTVYQLTGFILEAYQRIIIKGWLQKNFSLCIGGRSCGKSFLAAHFAYLYCLFNPDHHVLITSATFRSSRRILEHVNQWAQKKRKDPRYPAGELLLETFDGKLSKRPDMYKLKFKNGSSITAVPLGDPDNLRGFRCNALLIDEGLLIPQSTIDLVLKPFLAGASDSTRKQRIRSREDKLVAAGRRKADERIVFKSTSKMIILSSASYKWEELYATYKQYRGVIEGDPNAKKEEVQDASSSYLVQQISYKALNQDLMDAAILQQIRERLIPDYIIKREYEAQFIDESGGYFSAREMGKCTIPMGSKPCVEIRGESGAKYILAIDPSVSSSPAADHFAMCVLKIVKRKDDREVGLVVHQYACAGVELKHHIAYLYYLLRAFNIIYLICDTTQGDNADFVSLCNESEAFKSKNVALNTIDAEFANADFNESVKGVQRSYNPDSAVNRIVQKQTFSGPFLKAANEYLRASFDQELLMFASHAKSVPGAMQVMCEQDVLGIHRSHPEYQMPEDKEQMGNMYEFVNYQDQMIELVKKECALIEVTATPLGHLVFDLPHHMTRNRKNENRERRDSYAALLMANWAFKIYTAAMQLPPVEADDLGLPKMIAWRH